VVRIVQKQAELEKTQDELERNELLVIESIKISDIHVEKENLEKSIKELQKKVSDLERQENDL